MYGYVLCLCSAHIAHTEYEYEYFLIHMSTLTSMRV